MTRGIAVWALAVGGLLAADAVDMSGKWRLNVEKSKWGKKPKVYSADVTVDHKEPALRYKGTVVTGQNGESRSFEFAGSIDGKEHPHRDGTVTMRRVNERTVASEYKSADGKTVDRVRTSISEDGRTLTRQLSSRGPQGQFRWTEVYEKTP